MAKRRLTRAQRKRHLEAADWVLRNREGAHDPDDSPAFRTWLDEDPDNRRAYDAACRLMGDARVAIESDPGLRTFEAAPASPAKSVAGTLVVLAALGSLFLYLDGPMRLRADVMSGVADMPVIALDDGSTVQLKASSAIALDYSEGARVVRLLRGQAYFEVESDPNRPFSVEVGEARITALGTAFDVRLGHTETEITVTHNAVLVEIDGAEYTALRLSEGEQIDYRASGQLGSVTVTDAAAALAWRRGQLVVDNAPLSYLVEEIGRHFSGKIVIAGASLANRRISGTVTVSDTGKALTFLEGAFGLKTTRIGPLVILSE